MKKPPIHALTTPQLQDPERHPERNLLPIGSYAGPERAVRDLELELRTLYDTAPVALCVLDLDLRFLRVNQRLAEMNGLSLEAHLGRSVREIVPALADKAESVRDQVLATGKGVWDVEFSMPDQDLPGQMRYWLERWIPLKQAGRTIALNVLIEEVTNQRRAEQSFRDATVRAQSAIAELEDRARELETLLDTLPIGVWRADATCANVLGNRAAYEMVRLPQHINASVTPRGEVTAEVAKIRILVEGREVPLEQMPIQRAVFDGASVRHLMHQFVFPDGEVRIIDANVEPLRDGNGRVTGAVAAYMDVTEQKRIENALRDSEARLAAEADALSKLNELSSRLWRMQSLDEGLDEMLAATIELMGADMGNLQLLDAEHGVLRIAAQRGFGPDFLEFFQEVSIEDDSACGRALCSGERVLIADIETDAAYAPCRPIARAAGYRAVQSTPLIGRDGKPLGMISTHFRAVHRPSEQDLRRLDLYARQAVDFIERCRSDETLQESGRRKDEFLAVLAHELRNPLAPLRNGLQIAKLQVTPDSPLQHTLAMMERQLSHLVRLVDDLLDVNRIGRGMIALQVAPLELKEVLAQSIERCRHLIEAHHHALTVDVDAESVVVEGDAHRLSQVFSNLLSNSARYTRDGGTIHVSLTGEGAEAVVRVSDSGIGIEPEDIGRVFDMFAQVRNRGAQREGLGIGLYLVRALITMHGGTVSAVSEGLGKGSTFTVRLPRAQAPSPRTGGPATRTADAPSRPLRILVVDDNLDGAESLALLLTYAGHNVAVAHDGFAAIEQARHRVFDAIFMDIGMPGLDGAEAAKRIRPLPGYHDTPIVALTGWGQDRDRQRTREAGMELHLVKPVELDAIHIVLAKLLTPRARP
jgi:PAS domain S-box-containing protein